MNAMLKTPRVGNPSGTSPVIRRRPGGRRRLRVLISSAGRRVGLIRAFRSSAATLDIDLEVFATDVSPEWSAACMEADRALAIPSARSAVFIDAMLELCEQWSIDIVVPTIDPELPAYSQAVDRFAALGTRIVIGDPQLIDIAADKLATAEFMRAAGLPAPRTQNAADVIACGEAWRWPLLAKPRWGSSGRGIRQVNDIAELRVLEMIEPYVVQDILHGREYTINLYFDPAHRLCCAVPHERLRVRGGEVEKGVTVRNRALARLSRDLAGALPRPTGPMCYQAIIADDGAASLFEINTRFGGGYPLAHQSGATFTRWLMEEQCGIESTANDRWRADVVMLRYDDAIFI